MSVDTQLDTEVRKAFDDIKRSVEVIGKASFDNDCTFNKDLLMRVAGNIHAKIRDVEI